MTISEMFKELLSNLKIDNADVISLRYEEIIYALIYESLTKEKSTPYRLIPALLGAVAGD